MAWRNRPKCVVLRSLKSVRPNATLVEDDLEGVIRELKVERDGTASLYFLLGRDDKGAHLFRH